MMKTEHDNIVTDCLDAVYEETRQENIMTNL